LKPSSGHTRDPRAVLLHRASADFVLRNENNLGAAVV
jgi:hypothetical protein